MKFKIISPINFKRDKATHFGFRCCIYASVLIELGFYQKRRGIS
jgi:hypothetical protein